MLRKHSVTIRGHATSYSVEDAFHDELRAIAARRGVALARLVAEIDAARPPATNLSSAIRLFVLREVRSGQSAVG
ncbi:MAG: aryl-sulfate sulfotransferase [Alphaproteobacteria bacterium]|nr:MAG: aryl-sulfate sulfotransferase [Alphaproteobacteria bacterium]